VLCVYQTQSAFVLSTQGIIRTKQVVCLFGLQRLAESWLSLLTLN